jgi:hypothetical protein
MIGETLVIGETSCTYTILFFPQDQSFPDHAPAGSGSGAAIGTKPARNTVMTD